MIPTWFPKTWQQALPLIIAGVLFLVLIRSRPGPMPERAGSRGAGGLLLLIGVVALGASTLMHLETIWSWVGVGLVVLGALSLLLGV
jgi:hypothetical protein